MVWNILNDVLEETTVDLGNITECNKLGPGHSKRRRWRKPGDSFIGEWDVYDLTSRVKAVDEMGCCS